MKNFNKKKIFLLFILMMINLQLSSFTAIKNGEPENLMSGALHISESISWAANGTLVCNANSDQLSPQIVSDGSGGAIIVWEDGRNTSTTGYDIYARKINSAGEVQWNPNGVLICNATDNQYIYQIISDGAGGAIIAWEDERNSWYDIYIQRINSAGVVQWDANGTVICNYTGDQFYPSLASDSEGGAIVTWQDERDGSGIRDIYAQKINSEGIVQWDANGVVICNASGDQFEPKIVSDGAKGAIITWKDSSDIYAQRIDSEGITRWNANGTVICNATDVQFNPQITSDGAGGAIITYGWNTATTGYDIAVQKINSAGVTEWTDNGTVICNATMDQFGHQVVSDGAGGAIICWHDYRVANVNIYAQKINSAGAVQWTANGTIICEAILVQQNPKLVSDGAGGAIIAWHDERVASDQDDIYAQKINSAGTVQWTTNGIVICNADADQLNLQIVGDGAEGAIITWQDPRMGASDDDIYAQKISDPPSNGGNGGGGGPIPGFDIVLIGVISALSVITIVKMHYRKKKLILK